MRTNRTLIAASLATGLLLLTGCAGDETPTAEESPTVSASTSPSEDAGESEKPLPSEEPTPEGTVVEIEIEGDSVKPNGDRVEVDMSEPLTLMIMSDRSGELHVHSTPEQEVEFGAGHTETELTFDQPGVVEVEDHETGAVIVQLQVS